MKYRTCLPLVALLSATVLLQGCAALKKAATAAPTAGEPVGPSPGAASLLSMSYQEACALAAQHLDESRLPKIAADSIEVLSKAADGRPRKVRAKGKVFLQIDNSDHAHALCDEALITESEVILRGKPLLQRGPSTVEGLSDVTVFYLFGPQLRVIGRHRLTNLSQLASSNVIPWQTSGAVSLLPPLESSDVPEAVRDEMRKAAEAEAQLQKSRAGVPAAFPEAASEAGQKPRSG